MIVVVATGCLKTRDGLPSLHEEHMAPATKKKKKLKRQRKGWSASGRGNAFLSSVRRANQPPRVCSSAPIAQSPRSVLYPLVDIVVVADAAAAAAVVVVVVVGGGVVVGVVVVVVVCCCWLLFIVVCCCSLLFFVVVLCCC